MWMTRQQAADYLQISMRQLDRLGLPRSLLGKSPRYSPTVLDDWLKQREITPKEKGGPERPPRLHSYRRPVTDVRAARDERRKRLGY